MMCFTTLIRTVKVLGIENSAFYAVCTVYDGQNQMCGIQLWAIIVEFNSPLYRCIFLTDRHY